MIVLYVNEDIQRVYPGYIDESKFTEEHINSFVQFSNDQIIAAQLTLINLEKENDEGTIVYYNQEWFERWFPLAITGLPGPGGAFLDEKLLPVIITDTEFSQQQQGLLRILIVKPT